MERMEALQKKNQDLFADMKRLEREHAKSKKRADQLQKERDAQRLELTKMTGVKDRLEKLAREFTKDNKKLKVRPGCQVRLGCSLTAGRLYRKISSASRTARN